MVNWQLTEDALNLFLSFLDHDRDAAGKKYENIRRRLLVLFESRGCSSSEELADQTINRFIRRLPAISDSINDPIPYLLVIASNLYLEHREKQTLPLPENLSEIPGPANDESETTERIHDCLERCLEKLEAVNRNLVLDYYRKDKQAKIDFRKDLARRWGLTANALRIKMHSLRASLHKCLEECLESAASEMN